MRFAKSNKLSAGALENVRRQRVHSIPHFYGSFTDGAGATHPYAMVGGDPKRGGTTHVHTSVLPVSLIFDEFADANGNPLVIHVGPVVQPFATSPNFLNAPYGTGNTQFSDAVQRAEFWNVMGDGWHTMLERPRMLKEITMEIPVGAAKVFQLSGGGELFTLLDANFFISQFTTIQQLADFRIDELPVMITSNVGLSFDLDPSHGFIGGFHYAWDANDPLGTGDPGQASDVQTFAWASYIDPLTFPGSGFADVTGLSHEIAEWMNDPFIDNATENWAFPGTGGQQCQNNLETGDPVEVLANSSFPVTLHGQTYHPQTEALLQWFSQEVPSSAFQGAYSYPDTTALPGPAENCSAPAPDAGQ